MALSSGTKLGPYEVLAPLGAGGMGEVYRARDTRLGREVAVKVLPSNLSTDADRLRRFDQEARAASALNHPNILTIYDVGSDSGSAYLVFELLEGETLRHRLISAPLSPRKAIEYVLQVARGLAAAHEKGIVHRDLKPENLFITKDSHVKILDFGLAKLTHPEISESQITKAPTAFGTEPGVVMGTVAYMSPEQVRGQVADHRSDIFTLGTILYEMLTGERPFQRDSSAEIMNAILKEEPSPASDSNQNVSPVLSRIVQRCMEKTPDERFQSARDLAFAMEAVSGSSELRTAPLPTAIGSKARQRLYQVTTALSVFLALLFAIGYFRQPPKMTNRLYSSILPANTDIWAPALSPDGRRIVFVGDNSLWVRALDKTAPEKLSDTEGVWYPFWSPDSRYIAFFAGGKLKKVEASGGVPQTICDAPDPRGGSWAPDGTILFAPRPEDSLYSVSSAGGKIVPVTQLDRSKHETSHRWPRFLPDGRHFLYYVISGVASESELGIEQGIHWGSLDSKETKFIVASPSNAAFAEGFLLFVREGSLVAQHFEPKRPLLTGEPVVIAPKLRYFKVMGIGMFSVSENGLLTYITESPVPQRLVWLDRTGKKLSELADQGTIEGLSISPNSQKIAIVRADPQTQNQDIWIYDASRNNASRFTFNPSLYWNLIWSADGDWIVYSSYQHSKSCLCKKASNGSGGEEILLQSDFQMLPTDWSQDGRFIVYAHRNPKSSWDLWILPLFGDRKPFPFLQTPFVESDACFSPDGRWIAYSSNESGRNEVYVHSFAPTGGQWQVSTAGGERPFWRRDGKELLYGSTQGLMSVEVKASSNNLDFGVPKLLFKWPENLIDGDVAPDAQRFLFDIATEKPAPVTITLLQNWTDGLK